MRNVARGPGGCARGRWYRFRGEEVKENDMSETNIQEVVRQKYGEAAKTGDRGGRRVAGRAAGAERVRPYHEEFI